MGEFGKRQLYNLIKMKEWNNPDRPQTKDYTQESFEELINNYGEFKQYIYKITAPYNFRLDRYPLRNTGCTLCRAFADATW